jgi:1-pyrroline-5-carboxylate dehydrogenase
MFKLAYPTNEPVRSYEAQSPDRKALKNQLTQMSAENVEIPCFIGGQEVRTGEKHPVVMPHDHRHVLAHFHMAGSSEMEMAVKAAQKAKPAWEALGWESRASIFLKAADLIAGPYRNLLNASTMLGQSKNAYQAEIDAACELIDFLRFNAYFYQEIQKVQPHSSPGMWNRMEYRPLEGFVLAITPFNFTAIAGNLPATPAMLGNTVIWKPSETQMLSAYYTMKVLQEAGLPEGVINLVAANGPLFGKALLPHKNLAGVHFTGSTGTFQTIWKTIGENIGTYRNYPRLVGETGGKDFVFVHPSADAEAVATALIRGAFEYQGQKCSAASRAYIPQSLWKRIKEKLLSDLSTLSMGDVRDFRNFVNAVIDKRAFQKNSEYLEHAKNSADAEIIAGGKADATVGYFVQPTIIEAKQPLYKSMVEEIFGPILTAYIYKDSDWEEMLTVCDESSPYALTGAVFSQDRYAIEKMSSRLRNAAGNFYINDKPTGAVVGQQAFGGARTSGTNDKAGSALNLYRWLSARSIKETFNPPKHHSYPFMEAE